MKKIIDWDTNPLAAFATFVGSADFPKTGHRVRNGKSDKLSSKSVEIYVAMFGKFVRWLAAENKRFSLLAEYDLVRFISVHRSDGAHNSRISHVYLRLLERCFMYLEIVPNPATAAMRVAKQNHYIVQNKRTAALESAEIFTFVNALPGISPSAPQRAGRAPSGWKRRRDHAMQATMLFSGLRVTEAIGLALSEVDASLHETFEKDGIVLKITPEGKHDTSYAHETIVRSYGAQALRTWLGERAGLLIQGELVFPADLLGNRMKRQTVYR